VVKDFHGKTEVVFGDVSLSKNQVRTIHGTEQSPGAGGWPTVRHFNKETGYGGAPYVQKTETAMCDDLGPDKEYMQQYVETLSGASLCDINNTELGCSEEQKKFVVKWAEKNKDDVQKQITRLLGMAANDGASMTPESLKWLKQRLGILKQFNGKLEL